MTDAISPCRPGHGASCALCCGSHNFAASAEAVGALFARRRDHYGGFSASYLAALAGRSRSAMTGSYFVPDVDPVPGESIGKIFDDFPRCPFIALKDESGIIGCALHSDTPGEERHDCVRSYSGKRFRCEVHDALGDDEVRYAASLMRDWYYYSILIHSATILREIMSGHPSPGEVPPGMVTRLQERLMAEVHSRRELHAIHSYFD
ncbi:MAG: hypothetical protein JW838_02455 [Spirochaetes bacterium]|nr:hypothetical protein [Spirochaetota bacterium]